MSDIIDTLVAMDDAALTAKFGLDKQLDKAKKDIAELATMTGTARAEACERIEKMFAPNVYPSELGWIKEDAERYACRSAKDEMCDCSPASLEPR